MTVKENIKDILGEDIPFSVSRPSNSVDTFVVYIRLCSSFAGTKCELENKELARYRILVSLMESRNLLDRAIDEILGVNHENEKD